MNAGARLRLDEATRLLDGDARGAWQRYVVWLIRLALERELDAFWQRHHPAVRTTRSMRSKLLALGVVADPATQYAATELWSALSRAAHHHHYDLAPTAPELRSWLNDARSVCARLAAADESS